MKSFPSEWKYHTFFIVNNRNNKNPLALIYLLTFKARVSQVAQGWIIHLQCRRLNRERLDSWVKKIPWGRKWQPAPVPLLRKSHGEKSLVGYSPWLHRVGHNWALMLFKKIRNTKGTFHTKMGSIKDRNGTDLTEAEDIKKRWQEYTEELYKKDLNDPDNHNHSPRTRYPGMWSEP